MSYLRVRAEQLHVPPERFRDKDVHTHAPAGATPQAGLSAGADNASSALQERRTTPEEGRAAASDALGRGHGHWYDPR